MPGAMGAPNSSASAVAGAVLRRELSVHQIYAHGGDPRPVLDRLMAPFEFGSDRSFVNPQVRGRNEGSFQHGVPWRGEQDDRGCAVCWDRCASGARQRCLRRPGAGGGVHGSSGPVPGLPEAGGTRAQYVPTLPGREAVGSASSHSPAPGATVLLRPAKLFTPDVRRASRRADRRYRRSSIGMTGWLWSIAAELGGRPAVRFPRRSGGADQLVRRG